MAKNEQEILKELKKKYHSNLFDKNNELNWNGIDYTMKGWLEIGDTYLEKCSGYGSGEKTDILCVNKSLNDIITEYGEGAWESKAEKNGDIIRFNSYDHEKTIDNYVRMKYKLKSQQMIQSILDSSVEILELSSISLNAKQALEDNGVKWIGDIVRLEPNELFKKMQDIFGSESSGYSAGVVAKAVLDTGLAWESGEAVYSQWKEDGKAKYRKALEKSLADNVIEPHEWDELEEIAEKYGLSKDLAQDTIAGYAHDKHEESGKMPVIARPVAPEQAVLFSSCFNTHKHETEKRAVEGLQGEPVHYFENMSVELGKEILETLSADGGYAVYGDLSRSKLWLRDEQTGETEETNFNHILSKVQMITESWKRDETTVNENKFIEQLNSLETDDILVPIDVRYKFRIPEEIKIDSEKAERRLREGIERAIRQVFHEPSEMVHGSITTSRKGREADYTFRHNLVCSKETNYSNLNFSEIDSQLQHAVGVSLNDEFDLDHKILFSELKSFVPERFFLGLRQLNVNKETIEKFAKTPEEYANEATDEVLIKSKKATREELKEIFKKQKKAFDKVLSENPLLKKYVEEQWNELKKNSKDYIHSEEFISKFGDWEKANRIEKLKKAEPLIGNERITVQGNDITDLVDRLRSQYSPSNLKQLQDIARDVGKEVIHTLRRERNLSDYEKLVLHNNDSNRDFVLKTSTIDEIDRHNLFERGHLEAIRSIAKLAENSIFIGAEENEDNRDPRLKKFLYFSSGIKIDNENYTAKSVFVVTDTNELYYDQSLSTIEKGRLIDIIQQKNKLETISSQKKARNSLELLENKSPSEYYDKRLINICQVPQMPYLEMKDGKWQPKEEAIQAVKKGKLYIEKVGQNYQMHDSLNLAKKLAPKKQPLTLELFMKDVETQCGDDKSVKNILLQSANLIRNLDENNKKILREEFSKAEIKGQDSLVDFLDKKINPKKETKRSIQKSKDSYFERTR